MDSAHREGSFRFRELGPRAMGSYAAHVFKAVTQQHHRDLVPLLRRFVPADGVVLDVGGHAGQFAKLFARLAPQGRVVSVEPGSYARSILRLALRLNRLHNVELVPLGLSDRPGEAVLSMPIKRSKGYGFGLSHLGGAGGGGGMRREVVRLTTLDALAAGLALDRLDFIKADIEGWEQRMLSGGEATLARFRPVLYLEMQQATLARAGDSLDGFWRFLEGRGYAPNLPQPDGSLQPLSGPLEADVLWLPEPGRP